MWPDGYERCDWCVCCACGGVRSALRRRGHVADIRLRWVGDTALRAGCTSPNHWSV